MAMTPGEILRVISNEIQSHTMDAATWMQSFAEADGDDAKARARYIRLRQARLQAEAMQSQALRTAESAR